jgi:predicted alpha/beta hydrolase family esterase
MKRTILFIHSAGSQEGEHEGSNDLLRRLREGLGVGVTLLAPRMPSPDNPTYASWKKALDALIPTLPDEVVLVGHSLGGSVLLKYLSEEAFTPRIAGMVLIAMPYWGVQDWDVSEYMLREDFPTGLPAIRPLYLYQSDNDDVVSPDHVKYYATLLPTATVRTPAGMGHLFAKPCPELIDDIHGLL